jgi:hypothetical protein
MLLKGRAVLPCACTAVHGPCMTIVVAGVFSGQMKVLHIDSPHYLCSMGTNMLEPGVPYTVLAAHGPYPCDWQVGHGTCPEVGRKLWNGELSWREIKSGNYQIRKLTVQEAHLCFKWPTDVLATMQVAATKRVSVRQNGAGVGQKTRNLAGLLYGNCVGGASGTRLVASCLEAIGEEHCKSPHQRDHSVAVVFRNAIAVQDQFGGMAKLYDVQQGG